MTRREYVGAAPVTTLAAAIASGTTSFTVATGGGNGYPTGAVGPFFVVLDEATADEEKVLIANRSGDLFNVAGSGRGADGTQAVAHAEGATVRHVYTATDADEANAHVNSTQGHGTTTDVVGESDPQTLTNKTMSGASNTFSNIPQSAITNLGTDLGALDTRLDTVETDITNLEAADVALDARLDALETSPTIQVFTSSGTWNKPANLRAVRVRVVGGGGGGGGCAGTAGSQDAAGGGGAGGGYSEKLILAAALGSSETVTVGAAGSGGAAGENDGGTGGTSSFGAHCSATGGTGGAGGADSGTGTGFYTVTGGLGGTGSGGNINTSGGTGGHGFVVSGSTNQSAHGGSTALAGSRRRDLGSGAGDTGYFPGGGGSGAQRVTAGGAQAGGAGSAGVVIVENIF